MLRYHLPSLFRTVALTARDAFSQRSWPCVLATVVPWLLLGGQRSITRLAALASHGRSLSGYYRFLSRGKWRIEVLFRCLFNLIVRTFPPRGPLLIAVDDTLVPEWGHGIFGTASFFDHAQLPPSPPCASLHRPAPRCALAASPPAAPSSPHIRCNGWRRSSSQ